MRKCNNLPSTTERQILVHKQLGPIPNPFNANSVLLNYFDEVS